MASTETEAGVQINPDELANSVVDQDASLAVRRLFTIEGRDPFAEVEWEVRDAHIPGKNGPAFEQKAVEFPKFWSQTATNIVAQKYFRGRMTSPERETSVKQMIGRVVGTIGAWGRDGGYFATEAEAQTFEDELKAILVNQLAAFNSPVWFNVGFEEKPQCSACFILSIEDSMDSILDWIRREGIIFRGGSGSGVNLSRLRSSKEQLSKGGYASGPVSFMRGADASAGTIKSGGKTRRAAKMVVLDVDHPDILEFVWCKAHEEEKARVLEAAGYDMSLDSADWASIQYQNANNSVRVSDSFMEAVETDADWNLTARSDGTVVDTIKARKLMHDIAEAAWRCADPGVQYDTTINSWHTLPNSGRINASNPCSEYMSIDDSACNLASLNLMKFRRDDGELDVDAFQHACDVVFLAQEIAVGNSSYPTPEIERNAKAYRQLGLGYANLGALLMARGLAYDSDEGRAYAAAITALMTGRAYRKSAEIAGRMGAFAGYRPNAAAMLGVIAKHRASVGNIANPETVPSDLLGAARQAWDDALDLGEVNGYRNAQATVLAPTGTISFMMDCDTTGVEPDFSLVKSKKLVGGGEITIVNKTVPGRAREARLRADRGRRDRRVRRRAQHGRRRAVREERALPGVRLRRRRAGDPLPRPREDDGRDPAVHLGRDLEDGQPARDGHDRRRCEALRRGVEARHQGGRDLPRQLQGRAAAVGQDRQERAAAARAGRPRRRAAPPPPAGRPHRGRPQVPGRRVRGLHPRRRLRRRPARRHLRRHREGRDDAQGLMNSLCIAVSMGLQYGVPAEVYVSKLSHLRFEPSGPTNDADIRAAKSIPDYIFRWLGKKFLDVDQQEEAGILSRRFAPSSQTSTRTAARPRPRRPMLRHPARRRSSTPSRTRSSATAAAAGWCGRARVTRAATAARRPAAAEPARSEAQIDGGPGNRASVLLRELRRARVQVVAAAVRCSPQGRGRPECAAASEALSASCSRITARACDAGRPSRMPIVTPDWKP